LEESDIPLTTASSHLQDAHGECFWMALFACMDHADLLEILGIPAEDGVAGVKKWFADNLRMMWTHVFTLSVHGTKINIGESMAIDLGANRIPLCSLPDRHRFLTPSPSSLQGCIAPAMTMSARL